jgi:hypothetical protein
VTTISNTPANAPPRSSKRGHAAGGRRRDRLTLPAAALITVAALTGSGCAPATDPHLWQPGPPAAPEWTPSGPRQLCFDDLGCEPVTVPFRPGGNGPLIPHL